MADDWTRAMVADRLDLAADVMRSLPPVRPQGYVSAWPEYVHGFADQVGQEPRMRKPLPSPRMITQADEAMLWLRWADKDIGQILWARANRKAWKGICWEHGIIPSGAKADSGGDSQRAESLNLWRQVLGGHGHGYSDRIAGGF